MSEINKSPKKNKIPFLAVIAALIALGLIVTVGGFAFAASQESHDSFCASCHTQPETTYFQRSTSSQPTDLASFHTGQKVNCIDCHSGVGLSGRISAELMGARNAAMWYSGTAKQPAVLTFPIGDENCLKCHQDVLQRGFSAKEQITIPGVRGGEGEGEGNEGERANHWHTFLQRWQTAPGAVSGVGSCTSCHGGHPTGGTAQTGFLVSQTVQDQCEACHRVLRRGD